ncbi:MAG: DUF1501 domain-containing protein [Dehalococcoidia bacterium]
MISRRGFLLGCGAAALSGARISQIAFAADGPAAGADILVTVFLRGGIDGLNFLTPHGDPDYAINRPSIRIAQPGRTRGALDLDGMFGLHPAAAPLLPLWQGKQLALVCAVGQPEATKSHFEAMALMERGVPRTQSATTGWITRHLQTANPARTDGLPAIATQANVPAALLGAPSVAAVPSFDGFDYAGHWDQIDFQRITMRELYAGNHWVQTAGSQAFDIVDRVAASNPGKYQPANGAVYPANELGRSLQVVAQAIRLGLGLQAACIDFGGWDTHDAQGEDGQGQFAALVGSLAGGLAALMTDLGGEAGRVTVVVMSEFGRRLLENRSAGTDHGHGNFMLVLGGGIRGGIYGRWPTLRTDALADGRDLAATTDYRQILGEIVMRRLKNPRLAEVFPNAPAYAPLGFAVGSDQPVPPPTLGAPTPPVSSLFIPFTSR